MKNLISFITLLIFVKSIIATKEGLSDPVLDTEGNELQAGYRYLIRFFIWPGGDVAAYPLPNETCAVVEQRFGFPVIFRPAESTVGDVIPESTDLNIMFSDGILCGASTVWKVDEFDVSAQKYFVVTGGVAGNPGNETISNWFKIEKATNFAYKFVFCPKVCESCFPMCSDVGRIFDQDGVTRLALSEPPFFVVFQKLSVGRPHNRY